MGCSGSKSVSNRVIPMPVDADADDTTVVALNQLPRCSIIHCCCCPTHVTAEQDEFWQFQAKKAAWGDALSKTDMTDEERSNNTTPPRSAATGGDCPTEEPCALSQTVLESALAPATHSPVKQEVEDTTSSVILLSPAPTTLLIPNPDDGRTPLPVRESTDKRRPSSATPGRIVVYKTAKQKKAEEDAKLRRQAYENETAAAGHLARPCTSSRKASALPPIADRRLKHAKGALPSGWDVAPLPCGVVPRHVDGLGCVNTAKGGAAWQVDASDFMPGSDLCASPVKKPLQKLHAEVCSDFGEIADAEMLAAPGEPLLSKQPTAFAQESVDEALLHGSCLSPIKMAAVAKLEEAAASEQYENGRFSMLDEGEDHPPALQDPPSLGSTQEPPSLGSTLDSTVGVVWGAK